MPVAQPPPVAHAPVAVIRAAQQKVVPEAICVGRTSGDGVLLCPDEPSHPTGARVVLRRGGHIDVIVRGANRVDVRPLKPRRSDPSGTLPAHAALVAHRVDGRRSLWRISIPRGLSRTVTAADLEVDFSKHRLGDYLAAATVR